MKARLAAAAIALLLTSVAVAQPVSPEPRSIAAEPLAPPPDAPAPAATMPDGRAPAERAPPEAAAPAQEAPLSAPAARVFCEQPVNVQVADAARVAERYRQFIGIWSDASWSPTLCAALIVTTVVPDGTAAIVYVFGPMAANARGPGGVLHGTGIIRDGELRFQNSDGSQFAFRPIYADLDGRLTTPRGQNYQAVFKKTP